MKPYHLYGLSLLSGLMLWLSWPATGDISLLLFVAFVPLLIAEDAISRDTLTKRSILPYAYTCFFAWNALTTWWIYYSTFFGMVAAIVFNSLFMATIFWLFHLTKRHVGRNQGYIALVLYWIGWEYVHSQWELSWPWLTLGNGFANRVEWIQWYEFTGVFGGSLWVLVANIFIYRVVNPWMESGSLQYLKRRSGILQLLYVIVWIIVPVILSGNIYNNYVEKADAVNVVVVQPNIDPYSEKFSGSYSEQLQKMFALAETALKPSTDYLVFPETALTENLWENTPEDSYTVGAIRIFLAKYPGLTIITGASTYKVYYPGESLPATARKFRDEDAYYDAFNTALQFDSTGKMAVYHKSKLVVGVERMPYPALFSPLEKFAINLGGTSGSLGTQPERGVFVHPAKNLAIAPVICYESIYGEFVTEYIHKGARLIFIITNDGWWDDTPGYRQHLAYGSLRAIETRRSIARSANTGVSCFINQRGDIMQPTPWWQPITISATINANDKMTFYTVFGDYIARLSLFVGLMLLGWTIVRNKIKKT